MSVYLDTSCLLKLLVLEPDSPAVRDAVAASDAVVVSSLARLEAEVTLRGAHLGGRLRARQWRAHRVKLDELLGFAPFRLCALAGAVFEAALEQERRTGQPYCRSLDRLHLAAMQQLRIAHLMTHDEAQAAGARALGFAVSGPGRDSAG